jgi:general secretion pathway protein D
MGLVAAFLMAVLGAALMPEPALAQPAARDPGQRISMRYLKTDLGQILREVGPQLGERFLFETTLSGRVTIAVAGKVSRHEAFELLHAALQIKGYAAVPSASGGYRIVPLPDARIADPWSLARPDPRGESRIVTLVRIKHVAVQTLLAPLRQFLLPTTVAIALEQSNSVILGTTQRAIAALLMLIEELDQPPSRGLTLRTLRHRDAADLADQVRENFGEPDGAGRAVEVWADERTNTLIYRADPTRADGVAAFIDAFEVPARGSGEIAVLPLRYAEPKALADQLRELAGARLTRVAGASALAGHTLNITVDGPTHSLLVNAAPETIRIVQDLIEALDRPARQIALDLMVVELSFEEGLDLAFDLVPLRSEGTAKLSLDVVLDPTGGGIPAFAGPEVGSSLVRLTGVPLVVPIAGSPVVIAGDIASIADAREVHSNVLMEPHLVAVSGEEHTLFVGNNIPIPRASGAESTGLLQVQTTIDRTDTGVEVRVRPSVGAEGHVTLELDLDITSLASSLAGDIAEVGPTISTRRIQSTARLRDGEILLIATHSEQKHEMIETGVPFLKDIPFLGILFRATTEEHTTRRLLVAARARVLTGAAERAANSLRKEMAFDRARERAAALEVTEGAAWALRVATSTDASEARAIANRLDSELRPARVVEWTENDQRIHDVYLTGFESFYEATGEALLLEGEGFATDVVMAGRPDRAEIGNPR